MTKERVVEREKAVVRGQGDCWGGEDVLFLDNRPLPWQLPFLCESKKVAGSHAVEAGGGGVRGTQKVNVAP
jgi:hypothetical protein